MDPRARNSSRPGRVSVGDGVSVLAEVANVLSPEVEGGRLRGFIRDVLTSSLPSNSSSTVIEDEG